jgi:hypothetical protein
MMESAMALFEDQVAKGNDLYCLMKFGIIRTSKLCLKYEGSVLATACYKRKCQFLQILRRCASEIFTFGSQIWGLTFHLS